MIYHSIDEGLYDLAWLDRCPLLGGARELSGYAHVRARVQRRADAILDALYGDQEPATLSDTVVL